MDKNNYDWYDRKRPIFGLPLSFTTYGLTCEKLVIDKGFLNVSEVEVRLYRITDVTFQASLWQRMFGVGNVLCCSSDKTAGDFTIENIKNARDVKNKLSSFIEAERVRKRVTSREFMDVDDEMGDDIDSGEMEEY